MTQPIKYGANDPLAFVVEFLEKANEDELACKVIDVFAKSVGGSKQIEQVNLLAKLYLDVRNIPKAEEYALRVLGMSKSPEETYNARGNLAKLYNNVNEPDKSLFHSKLNQLYFPDDVDTQMETVFSLYLLNRKAEAETILRSLKAREHELEEHHQDIVNFNLGTYDLERGKFIEGLKGFMLKGRKLNIWFLPRQLPYKFWEGGAHPGKTLILFAEGGGIGDEMLSIRYMDDLKAIGFRPVFYTSRKEMYDIFNRCGYETVMTLEGIPEDALWTYFMLVPIYLESKAEDMTRSKYLFPSDAARIKWGKRFANDCDVGRPLRIGIRWQGNSKNERDLHRKVPLNAIMQMFKEFEKEIKYPVDFFSLQVGEGSEEGKGYPLNDLTRHIDTYDDTLALLEKMDYVITSCTSVLHASAIVGTKTLALVPISAYFTWVSPSPGNTSIWYPDNLQVFKQVTPKKWDEPLAQLKDWLLNDLDM